MREHFKFFSLISLLSVGVSHAQTSSTVIPGKYIIILKDSRLTQIRSRLHALVTSRVGTILGSYGIHPSRAKSIYSSVTKGFAASLTHGEVEKLRNDDRVLRVEADQVYSIDQTTNYCPVPVRGPSQLLGWGPQRTGYGTGTGKVAWVVDTGIDLCHPDLNVDKARSKSFVDSTPADDHGHGTHVAGIIGAKNNKIGMRGVASNTKIVAVKVLGADGKSSTSVVIAGLDYVYQNIRPGQVVNLSLGGPASQSMDDAVKKVAAKGAWVVVAAGNDGKNSIDYSPARANARNIFTISAFSRGDAATSWSNFGTPVDFALPGDNIYSTFKNGSYARMSGTSMAAPHMAGLLLLRGGVVRTSGYVTGDVDGIPDPIAVK